MVFHYLMYHSIQWPIHKDGHMLCSWLNQLFERISWLNDSRIKTETWRHLLAVLVSYLEYHFTFVSQLKNKTIIYFFNVESKHCIYF